MPHGETTAIFPGSPGLGVAHRDDGLDAVVAGSVMARPMDRFGADRDPADIGVDFTPVTMRPSLVRMAAPTSCQSLR